MAKQADFEAIFLELKKILEPYAPKLVVVSDTGSNYYLDTAHVMKNKKPLFFGSVRIGKAYVSYYLMALYLYPDLLDNVSPELKKRMQGKSCFNFKTLDKELLKELARVTKQCFARYEAEGYV